MAKQYSRKFYLSAAWMRCRQAYKQSVNGLCEKCLVHGKVTPGDEVHHKIAISPANVNDPDITLNWGNLQLLCFKCHQDITHNRTRAIRDGLMFNSNGELIKIDDE